MFPSPLLRLAEVVLADARIARLRIVTAESCTGGMIGALLTEIPGSSDVFDRGFIVYTNRSKQDLLGVPGDLVADMGEVSEAVCRMMAEGAIENSNAQLAVAVTGIAGPTGGLPGKPVGTVWIGWKRRGQYPLAEVFHFDGDRESVRRQTVAASLQGLLAVAA